MDMFAKQKQDILDKKDKSKKGSIDAPIKKLVDKINSCDNFYTTSSCSGRIMLIAFPRTNKKFDAEHLFSTHDKADYKKILANLFNEISSGGKISVWFKMEPFILHICCKDWDNAKLLIDKIRNASIKKYGAVPSRNRIMVEVLGSDFIQTPLPSGISKWPKNLVEEYVKELTICANKKMEKNLLKLKQFESEVMELN